MQSDKTIPMTLRGYSKLQNELRNLRNNERPAIIEAIASARELGDLSENAEYHSAKEKQSIIESRIRILEDRLSRASVIDTSLIHADTIKFGASVKIMDDDTGSISEFQIVGSDEADIKAGLMPITAPVAKALISKKIDDSITVNVPSGMKSYTVLAINYE